MLLNELTILKSRQIAYGDLFAFFRKHTTFLAQFYSELVYENPSLSVRNIAKVTGSIPSISGTNNEMMVAFRDRLFALPAANHKAIRALTITAPHTHWEDMLPIIYKYDGKQNRYLIGHHQLVKNEQLIPVSFVFHKQVAIPYEWALLEEVDTSFLACFKLIDQFAKMISTLFPFGLTIDFRFRKHINEAPVPSAETPIDEQVSYYGFSEILPVTDYTENRGDVSELEQVAWHAESDKWLSLSDKELETLQTLRSLRESDPLFFEQLVQQKSK